MSIKFCLDKESSQTETANIQKVAREKIIRGHLQVLYIVYTKSTILLGRYGMYSGYQTNAVTVYKYMIFKFENCVATSLCIKI